MQLYIPTIQKLWCEKKHTMDLFKNSMKQGNKSQGSCTDCLPQFNNFQGFFFQELKALDPQSINMSYNKSGQFYHQ